MSNNIQKIIAMRNTIKEMHRVAEQIIDHHLVYDSGDMWRIGCGAISVLEAANSFYKELAPDSPLELKGYLRL